jgi:hypothetical protein
MSNTDPMKDWRGVNSIDTVNIGGEVKDKLKHDQQGPHLNLGRGELNRPVLLIF